MKGWLLTTFWIRRHFRIQLRIHRIQLRILCKQIRILRFRIQLRSIQNRIRLRIHPKSYHIHKLIF